MDMFTLATTLYCYAPVLCVYPTSPSMRTHDVIDCSSALCHDVVVINVKDATDEQIM